MLASIANQKEGTQLFLEFKASVKTADVKGYTAPYLAAKYGNYELLKILLKEDEVDVNHKSNVSVWSCILYICLGFFRTVFHCEQIGSFVY